MGFSTFTQNQSNLKNNHCKNKFMNRINSIKINQPT